MKKNTTDQSLNPLVRAALKANWEGAFDHLNLPKSEEKHPPRIRLVRKRSPKGASKRRIRPNRTGVSA